MNRNVLRLVAIVLMASLWSVAARAQSLSLTLHSHPSGIPLSGSGSGTTAFHFGSVQKRGAPPPAGVTRQISTSHWSLSSLFGVRVILEGGGSGSYSLGAELSTIDGIEWTIGNAALIDGVPVIIDTFGAYDEIESHSLQLTIPDTHPAGSFGATITFTAVAN